MGALTEGQSVLEEHQKIWMIEPRRLATKAAAARLAESLRRRHRRAHRLCRARGTETIRRTQVEVITDGLFLRRLQSDPPRWGGVRDLR